MLVRHGVDFSGAENPAGKIWVATRDDSRLHDESGKPVIGLRRGFDHRSLVELIAASANDGREHLWRIDAPFGLAVQTLDSHGIERNWLAMAKWIAQFGSARGWRSACRETDRSEPRRVTDHAARTPMAPLNLRVFKQTWAVITNILMPLTERGIRIEPLAGPTDSLVIVAEGCPASTLALRGWPTRGYKGIGEPPKARRAELIEHLKRARVRVPDDSASFAINDTEGDGLDALLLLLDPEQTVVPAEGMVEGWVY